MAFKTVKTYNEEKFGGLFLLRNDGDYADVVFLYQSIDDVLVADTHYIKSAEYSGYVHCCGRGCPACAKNIRVQTKLFIPMYNITTSQVEFWDRSIRFEPQLSQDVFTKFPNPSEYVFRIVRKGAAGDVNTVYHITAVGRNTIMPFEDALKINNIVFPAYYENICKDVSASQLLSMLTVSTDSNASDGNYTPTNTLPNYQISPRASATPTPANIVPTPDDMPATDDEVESLDNDGEVVF